MLQRNCTGGLECPLKLYSSSESDFKFIQNLIEKDTVAMHTHSSILRHSTLAKLGKIDPNHVMYKLMKIYCPLTEEFTLRKRIGKSYLDFLAPMTSRSKVMPWGELIPVHLLDQ